jgi:diguanylate cyclase
LTATYNYWLVGLSVLVAVLASYAALRLAARVAEADRGVGRIWLIGGGVAMGIGIWSMHFIGMLAFSLPISLRYDIPTTAASLAIGIVTSMFAIWIASGSQLRHGRLASSALVMGGGICAMHYSGMAAIQIVPMIRYEPGLVVASAAIAITASYAALWLAFRLRHEKTPGVVLARAGAATVMALAISGMHYTGMAASAFGPDSYCQGGVALDNERLAVMIGMFAIGLLAIAIVTSIYDAHLQSRMRLAVRLEEANAALQHQATHDTLTGLPNRALFVDRLTHAIDASRRGGRRFAVFVLDLDRFKLINDSLGHGFGDRMLQQVGLRLHSIMRRSDTVARFGGDEFLLVVDEDDRTEITRIANRIMHVLGEPVKIDSSELHTAASIGISTFPADGDDPDRLIAHADAAMYSAKRAGGNCIRFFTAGMSRFTQERFDLENDLHRALAMGEFELHYQPKVEMTGGVVSGVEALIRWHHPTRGMVPPATFIPIAEETGLIFPIGEWVLREACRQARDWQVRGLPLRVAVNLSAVQFRQSGLLPIIRSTLEQTKLPPQHLEIELTESTVMTSAAASVALLQQLAGMGISLAIDDFGMGYSCLSYLRRLPIDRLKIDRSFVREMDAEAGSAHIVQAIVSLAHSLRMRVVAEGVETAEQLDRLHRMGCNEYQGYYFSAPASAREIEALVRGLEPATHETGPIVAYGRV